MVAKGYDGAFPVVLERILHFFRGDGDALVIPVVERLLRRLGVNDDAPEGDKAVGEEIAVQGQEISGPGYCGHISVR